MEEIFAHLSPFKTINGMEVAPEEILAAIPNAVFATDKQMRILYFNRTAEAITGFKRTEAVGMFCRDVFKSSLCERDCLIKRALDSGKRLFHVKSEIVTVDGQKIPVLANSSLLHDRSGRIVGYLVILQDISDIQKTLEELETAKALLEDRNRSLRRAYKELKLTQEYLIEAQKMESLGRLSGGMAHHFNNILCEILGYVELLRNRRNFDHRQAQSYLNKIEKSVLKAVNLVQKILTFAQTLKTQEEEINLNHVIYELVGIIRDTLADNVRIELRLAPDLPPVKGDAHQIYHALFNLCINAQDAMPTGGIITISTYTETNSPNPNEPERLFAVIRVADTGMGIKPDIRDKVFDPFFTTKEPGKGTGLGLSMVHGIVKSHGGHVKFESSSQGTTFFLYFPVGEAPSA